MKEKLFELTTDTHIEDVKTEMPTTINTEDLAKAFLGEAIVDGCFEDVYVFLIDGRKLTVGVKLGKRLMAKFNHKYTADGSVSVKPSRSFQFSRAKQKIKKLFKFTKFHFIGTKNNVKGVTFSSKVGAENPYDHRNKFGALYKTFAKNTHDLRLKADSCLTTISGCPKDEKEFLENLEKEIKRWQSK